MAHMTALSAPGSVTLKVPDVGMLPASVVRVSLLARPHRGNDKERRTSNVVETVQGRRVQGVHNAGATVIYAPPSYFVSANTVTQRKAQQMKVMERVIS